MSTRLRTAFLALAALAALGVLALAAVLVLDLHALMDALSDPETIVEGVVDEYLSANPHVPDLRTDDPLLVSRKILVTSNINEFTAEDVAARLLYLSSADPHRPIDLFLSTQGGWVDSAFTIIDAMDLIEAPVNTWALGGCYSAGALILAAGTGRRYATENAVLMIHASLDEDTKRPYSYEHLALDRYERIWREHAALPEGWFPMIGGEEYYLSPEEALQFRLIDEIVPANGEPASPGTRENPPPRHQGTKRRS